MVQEGLPAGAALRSAKLDMLRSGDHAHPFHWAAFVLWGLGD
jgi:CHAT domain-containing protein